MARPATPEDANEMLTKWGPAVRNLSTGDALRLLLSLMNQSADNDVSAGRKFFHARVSGFRLGTFDMVLDSALPEEISAGQINYGKAGTFYDVWCSFAMRSHRKAMEEEEGQAPRERRIATRAFRIKASVRPPESIDADAVVTVEAQQAGLRSVIFELSRSLRVSSVE